MGLSVMYDASSPPARPPASPVVAFYIGGDTPHVWTDAEIASQPATFGLPIYVHDYTQDDHEAAAQQIITWLAAHQWEHGAAVAIDTEAVTEPAWIEGVDKLVTAAGWPVIDYESKGPAPSNPVTSGGRWIADWTGEPHLYPGSVATQYASAAMLGGDCDLSVIDTAVKLHQLHRAPVPPPPPPAPVTIHVPQLAEGAAGSYVRSLQVLLNAYSGTIPALSEDEIFGPLTQAAVLRFQAHFGLAADGIAGPLTWQKLVSW